MLRQTGSRAFFVNPNQLEPGCLPQFAKCLPQSWTLAQCDPRHAAAGSSLLIAVGLGAHEEILRAHTGPVLVVLESESDDVTLQAAMDVADDVVVLPARDEEVRYRIQRLLGGRANTAETVSERLSEEFAVIGLVGEAPIFKEVLRQVQAMSRSDAPVLITGETGTGKEMCARAIHHLSRRRNLPFIPIDCGAIPAHLFENEVFGHSRGAFTDAQTEQKGLVAMADGGTLFLDEMDTLPTPVQAKLLRFLQEHTYRPLGSDRFLRSDVRIISASNQNVEALATDGHFRTDLYFRLNVLRLELPTLRERREDIEVLARRFTSGTGNTLSPGAIQKLNAHEWPGNVRELYNVIQRASVLAESGPILPCHIRTKTDAPERDVRGRFQSARTRAIECFERDYVEQMLDKHKGNVTHAAREAGKERRAFGRLVKKYARRGDDDPHKRVSFNPPNPTTV